MKELIKKLNNISNQTNELFDAIIKLEEQLVTKKANNLIDDLLEKRKILEKMIEKYQTLAKLDDQYCETVTSIIKLQNTLAPAVPTNLNLNSLDLIEETLQRMEEKLPTMQNGTYKPEDFSHLSESFINQYRELLSKKNNLIIKANQTKLKTLNEAYLTQIATTIKKYQIGDQINKYNIGGAIFELNTKSDLEKLYNLINVYEKSKSQEKIQIIPGIPVSNIPEKLKTKIDQMQKEKQTPTATIKKFENKARKRIKQVGSKLVAIKQQTTNNLRNYYSHINMFNEDTVKENELIENQETSKTQEENQPILISDLITKNKTKIQPQNENDQLLSKYAHIIIPKIFGKHTDKIKNISKEEIDFTINNYVTNLIKVGNEKYGNNFIEDILKEKTEEPIKWLIDEVSKGEKLKNIKEETKSQIEPINPTIIYEEKPKTAQENVYAMNTEDYINHLNEQELNQYIKDLNLSVEELKHFKQQKKQYKKQFPGIGNFWTNRACIQTIIQQRKINQYRKEKDKQDALDSIYEEKVK